MLDNETKRRIDTARDILVGKLPDPKSQVEQITIALIYKFMDDMDAESVSFGGEPSFFVGDYEKYGWRKLLDLNLSGFEALALYGEAMTKLHENENLPQLFRDIFKNAYLPYRDPETLKLFLKTINGFTYDHSERLGDAFEYLLSVLGSQGDAGQFRTPRHIIDFIVKILDPQKTETISDPACGTAGFLISAYKHILAANQNLTPDERKRLMTNFAGYDISPDMVRLSLVNMYLHGFPAPHIYEYDSLTSEDRWSETFDIVMANPPFMSPKGGIKPHKKFSINANRSEVLFVDYILEHINPKTGRAGIIIPEGIMYVKKSAYLQLRKMLIDKQWLYAVATLPSGVFKPYASVKTNILFIDKTLGEKTKSILFVDISNDGFSLSDTRKPINSNDIPQAQDLIIRFRDSLENNNGFILLDKDSGLGYIVDKSKIKAKKSYHLISRWYKVEEEYKGAKYPLKKLGDLCVIKRGLSPNMKTNPGDYVMVVPAPNKKTADHFDFEGNAVCIPLISSSGHGKADMKRLHFQEGKFALADTMAAVFPTDATLLSAKYLFEALSYKKDEILVPLMKGAANVSLDCEDLRDVLIPLPPIENQLSIVYRNNYEQMIAGAELLKGAFSKNIFIEEEEEIIKQCESLVSKLRTKLKDSETIAEIWGINIVEHLSSAA